MNLATKKQYKPDPKAIEEYHKCMAENWKKAMSFADRWKIYAELNRADRERLEL